MSSLSLKMTLSSLKGMHMKLLFVLARHSTYFKLVLWVPDPLLFDPWIRIPTHISESFVAIVGLLTHVSWLKSFSLPLQK